MSKSDSDKICSRYNRISSIYDFFEKPMEAMMFRKWRAIFIRELKGKVLEVGVGTGKNIPYYPDQADVTAIDFSEKMLAIAQRKAAALHKKVNLLQMDAQEMSFPDNTFDQVLTTCVFCSVPDPVKGLKEIRRVCKPNGKIIMLEHVRSEKKVLGLIMDLLNPIPLHIYGANINRRTIENLQKAGFAKIKITPLASDVVLKIEISNEK